MQSLITDDQSLVGAKSRFGHPIPTYDDGDGQLWIHRNSMGISGIVRVRTWEDAYSICEDEFFPEAESWADMVQCFKKDGEALTNDACWQESYGFRPNGRRSGNQPDGTPRDPIGHGIYAKDLNGDTLDLLTPELLARLEITLQIETTQPA